MGGGGESLNKIYLAIHKLSVQGGKVAVGI